VCGIAGILGSLNEANRSALTRMSAALVHRGPDDARTWESAGDRSGRGVMLAFRRLAILDLSETGAQPMIDPDSGTALVFNGEVYNYSVLRAELRARKIAVRSSGDTEVVLRSLASSGPDALRAFRGMFALASWDPRERQLLLARDPLGIKPLYLARNEGPGGDSSLLFASEIRALLASGLLGKPRLDPRAVASMVWNGFVVGPSTMVQGVELLPAGEAWLFDGSSAPPRKRTFWTFPEAQVATPATEAEVSHAMSESVRLHLASDVPLAVFLSGGVDSSSVANLAQKANREPVHTFTLSFEEPEYDEGPAACAIARAIGTEHRQVVLSEGEFVSHLDRAIDALDQPTFDGLNSFYLSRAVREAGFTVALVGTGGDELFGGYPSFRDLPALHRWSARLGFVPRAALVEGAQLAVNALQPERREMPRQARWAKLPEMVRRGDDLLALYQLAYALFLPDFQEELLAPSGVQPLPDGLPPTVRERLERAIRDRSEVRAIAALETRMFLGERLLRDNDVASMAVSLEQRLPLVDSVVLETVERLPDELRFRPLGRKALLRRCGLAGLDPALFERPKRGFVLPFELWIRRTLGPRVEATLLDPIAVGGAGLNPIAVARLWRGFLEGAPGLYWSRIWALYVLVRWCERNLVRLD